MKNVLMIISVVLLLGGVFLFLRNQKANQELRDAQTQATTLSNQVWEARVKITEHTVHAVKLETNLTRRVDELLKTSGRLAVVNEKLGKSEAQLQSTQAQAQEHQKQATAAEGRIKELQDQLREKQAAVESQDAEIDQLEKSLRAREKEVALLATKLQRSETDAEALRRDFNDSYVLREQLDRIKRFGTPAVGAPGGITVTNVAEHGAQQLAIRPRDPKGRIVLQPDGTVRLAP